MRPDVSWPTRAVTSPVEISDVGINKTAPCCGDSQYSAKLPAGQQDMDAILCVSRGDCLAWTSFYEIAKRSSSP